MSGAAMLAFTQFPQKLYRIRIEISLVLDLIQYFFFYFAANFTTGVASMRHFFLIIAKTLFQELLFYF